MTLLGAGVGSIAPVVSWVSGTDAFPSTLSFSRTSNATMFDSTGYLTYAPNNLLTQSGTFTDASWSKLNQTVSGNTVTATSTSVGLVYKAFTPTANVNYVLSFDVAPGTAPYIVIDAPNGASDRYAWFRTSDMTVGTVQAGLTASVSSIGGGRYRIAVSFNGGAGSATSYAISASAADNSNTQVVGHTHNVYNAVLSAVTYETSPRPGDQVITTASAYYGPRIDYDPNTLAVKGLLIEEARTNGVINSTDPAVWAVLGVANTTGVTDPQALTKAATVTAAAGAGYHYTSQTGATASAGQARVVSVFVKQGTAPYVNFGASGDASWHVGWMKWSDLSTGSTNGTVSVQACANGYYRLSLAFTMASAATVVPYVGPDVASRAIAPNYTAAGTETVIAWGLQDEPGYFATSYIPTAAASVTRAADVVQFTGAALTALQGTNFSAIGEAQTISSSIRAYASIMGGPAGSTLLGQNSTSTNQALADLSTGSITANFGSGTVTSPYRIGASSSASAASLVANGGTVSNGAFSLYTRASGVYLGSWGSGSGYLNGWVRSFAIYNQRLPDATLQAKSVVGASYAANDNGIRYAFADNDNLPIHWRVAL